MSFCEFRVKIALSAECSCDLTHAKEDRCDCNLRSWCAQVVTEIATPKRHPRKTTPQNRKALTQTCRTNLSCPLVHRVTTGKTPEYPKNPSKTLQRSAETSKTPLQRPLRTPPRSKFSRRASERVVAPPMVMLRNFLIWSIFVWQRFADTVQRC